MKTLIMTKKEIADFLLTNDFHKITVDFKHDVNWGYYREDDDCLVISCDEYTDALYNDSYTVEYEFPRAGYSINDRSNEQFEARMADKYYSQYDM